MSCPYFKEGYFGICVAPDAIHVPSIAEMEKFCFRVRYESCPNFADIGYPVYSKKAADATNTTETLRH